MVKTITFNNGVSIDTVDSLIEYMEQCLIGFDGLAVEKVRLNWSSCGGSYSAMMILVDYLNEYPLDIEIIAFDECYSAGLITLLYVNRPIKLLTSCSGMFHISDTLIGTRELRDTKSYSVFQKSESDKIDAMLLEDYRMCGLSDEELKFIEDGKDLFVSSDRLAECIQNYKSEAAKAEIDEEIFMLENELSQLRAIRSTFDNDLECDCECNCECDCNLEHDFVELKNDAVKKEDYTSKVTKIEVNEKESAKKIDAIGDEVEVSI